MNAYTNRFEQIDNIIDPDKMQEPVGPDEVETAKRELQKIFDDKVALMGMEQLIRPEAPFKPIWSIGDRVEVNGYFFEVMDIGEDRVTLKPVGPYIVGEKP